MDRVQLCTNLSLRCELQSTRGITLPPLPRACLSFLLRASFLFCLSARSGRAFLPQELLNAGLYLCPPKARNSILRTMTQLPCESKLAPDPFTGRLMWVQWSKDRHLSSGVLLYGDSNNSFWYFSSRLRFWTRAWTCVLGRGRVEPRRVARHAAWWMRGRKS